MAYAVKYLFRFESLNHTTREIRVLQDGYSGSVIQRALGRNPVLKKQQNGPIHGTSLEIYAQCDVDREFIEFYTSDPKEYRVDVYAGNTMLWQGWISPELYSEPDIAPPYDVQVVATDGVGELKLYDFAAQGTVTLRALLTYLLGLTGLSTDVFLVSSLKAGGNGAGALLNMKVNMDYMVGKTCYDVLRHLLDTLHASITWWKGAWMLVRETNVTFTNGKLRYFNTSGNSALLADSVQDLGSLGVNNAWPVGQLTTVIDPAKNKVAVQAPWHPVTGFVNPDMTSDTGWNKVSDAEYDTNVGAYWIANVGAVVLFPAYIEQMISFGGLKLPLRLRVNCCGSVSDQAWLANNLGRLEIRIVYNVGNDQYSLQEDGDGNLVWMLDAAGSLTRKLSVADVDRESAETVDLVIPPFVLNGEYVAGQLGVAFSGSRVFLFGAYLDLLISKGYQDILRIDNGARGEADDVEVSFGKVTSEVAYYQGLLQGILLDGTTIITAFQDANFPTNMDFLAFISRDYALSVALPRARFEGTVFLESGVALPPLVFTKNSVDYWVETFAWDMYEDELRISIKSLPAASLTVESETIGEASGSAYSSSSSTGGGSPSAAITGGTNYFEKDGDFAGGIKLRDEFDAVRVPGLRFGDGAQDPDLYVDTVEDSQGNPQRVLRSPLPLITAGDQIVISGTPGQGGGGGGATFLPDLEDVSDDLYAPTAGMVLQYSGSEWVGNLPATQIGANVTGLTTGALIYGVLGDGFNPNWTVKDFINSSISTATAEYRGSYNEKTDLNLNPSATRAQVATKLGTVISVADDNDYCFVEIPTSSSTPTEIARTERYKYNGTSWAYEYTLNNSGFTSEQWASINSGITSGKVSSYDTIAGYFSGGKILSTALPAMYIGTTAVRFTSATQDLTGIRNISMSGNITIPNGNAILAASSVSMLAVNSLGTTFYCGPGYEISSAFLLRSGDINLVHRKYTAANTYTDHAIWDSANTNISDAALNLGSDRLGTSSTPIGYATQAKRPFAIAGTQEAGGFDLNTVLAGGGAIRNVYSSNYWAHAPAGTTYFGMAWQLMPSAADVGSMQFFWDGPYTGAAPTDRLFWRLRNSTGWADDWHRIYDSANANLSTIDWNCKDLHAYGVATIGTATAATGATLTVDGAIASSGDQVITSDIRMKTHLKPIKLSVEQIAKCRAVTFDWTAGGHSFGSIAQDWQDILPEAVHDGKTLSLAYAQLGTVIGITLAKHETEQDKEIRELKEEVKNLKAEVKRLRAN